MTARNNISAALIAAFLTATASVAGPTVANPAKPAGTAKPAVKAAKPAPKPTTSAKPAPKPSAKPAVKPFVKPPAKPLPPAGKTPAETVNNLIAAMRKEDKEAISRAFDWQKFAAEMNKLVPDKQGLSPDVYETLLVETFNVGPDISKDVRLGKVTQISPEKAKVEMERLLPVSEEKDAPKKYKTINELTLYKSPTGWRIYRLDSAKEPPIPMPKPAPPRAQEGMVPAAGGSTPPAPTPKPVTAR